MPSVLKWALSAVFGGFIFKIAENMVNTYLVFSFETMQDVTSAFRTQYLIDLLLVFVVFILTIAVLDIHRRYG